MKKDRFEHVESRQAFWLKGLVQKFGAKETKEIGGGFGHRLCAFPNDLIGREIAVTGTYEASGIAAVNWLCEHEVIQGSEAAFLDIGANVGVYSVGLAHQFSSVLAFEPHPAVNQLLRFNVRSNDLNNVSLFNFGLSEHDSTALLWEGGEGNLGASSLERGVGLGMTCPPISGPA